MSSTTCPNIGRDMGNDSSPGPAELPDPVAERAGNNARAAEGRVRGTGPDAEQLTKLYEDNVAAALTAMLKGDSLSADASLAEAKVIGDSLERLAGEGATRIGKIVPDNKS